MQYGFIIDNRKCIGCHACTVACKAEHKVPVGVNRTWVKYIEKGEFPNSRRIFSVMRCNHCSDAPCVDICPTSALHTREDGIVDFDNRRCIGCKACMQACPYDALYIDPETSTAAKCNYCSHRTDIGLEPACVNVCPEHAIISGDMDDPTSEIALLLAGEQVSARKVEKGTRPNLFYIDGDAAALNPAAAEPSADYMWSGQTSGVGHFVRYAESLVAKSDPLAMASRLSNPSSPAKALPADTGDAAERLVATTTARQPKRVYDAPAKGVLWGWEVSTYVWTKAISAGMFLVMFPFLAELMPFSDLVFSPAAPGIFTALIFLALTGLLLVKDLDRPDRFAYVLLRPHWGSWLVRGGYSISIFGLLLLGAFVVSGSMLRLSWVWITGAAAVMTAIYTAFLFAQAKGRDFWQSPVLALHMLIHALLAGAAVFTLFETFLAYSGEQWQEYLYLVMCGGLVLNLLVIVLELSTPHATADAKKAVELITRGPYKRLFWLGTILLGNLLPFLLLLLPGEINSAAAILILIGIYITEHIWVQAPQQIPLS